jgi:hypothetical protein
MSDQHLESEQMQATEDFVESAQPSPEQTANTLHDFLWTLPQPILVLGSMLAVASAFTYGWAEPKLFALIMIILPLPLILLAERIWVKRQDWILTPKEFAEDAFWLAATALIWVPIYSDYYSTPISDGFKAVRDASPLNFNLEPTSTLGLILAAILVRA